MKLDFRLVFVGVALGVFLPSCNESRRVLLEDFTQQAVPIILEGWDVK